MSALVSIFLLVEHFLQPVGCPWDGACRVQVSFGVFYGCKVSF